MKKKTKENLIKIYEDKPLHKQDEISRRNFIRNVGTILGVFGVPFTIRMEAMENISKKIFGSATAFAQGTNSALSVLMIGARAGDPFRINLEQDATDPTINNTRTIASNPNENFRVTPSGAQGNDPDVIIHQRAGALQAHADGLFRVSNRSSQGHSSNHDMVINPATGTNILVDAALQNTNSPLSQAPFVFGQASRVNYSQGAPSGVSPNYVNSIQQVADLFGAFQIESPNGGQLISEQMSQTIVGSFISGISGIVQKILGEGSDAAQQFAGGSENVITLFQTNVGEVLGAPFNAQERADFGIDSINDFNIYNSALTLPEFFAFATRMLSLNVTTCLALSIDDGDWHGNGGMVNDSNSVTGNAANYIAESMAAFLSATTDNDDYKTLDGQDIAAVAPVLFSTEFTRGPNNNGSNFTDGGDCSAVGSSPLLKGGSYGDFDSNGNRLQWDPGSGNFVQDNGSPDKTYYANAAAAGIDVDVPSEYQAFIDAIKV